MKELIYHRQFLPAINTFGAKTAVVDGAYEASFEQHGDRVLRLANAMQKELGVSRSDRFAVMAVNCHEYLELYHAAYLGAGVINPLNLRLAPKELAYIITDSGTEVIFTDPTFAPLVAAARKEIGDGDPIRQVVLIGEGDAPHDVGYESLLARQPENVEAHLALARLHLRAGVERAKGLAHLRRALALDPRHPRAAELRRLADSLAE